MTAVLLALTACDPEAEGCLDYRAVAIDVTADVACDDCCRYPSLRLQVVPGRLQADTFVREAAPTLIVDGDTLRATRLPTYLSDFALELADGSLYPLTDTLTDHLVESGTFGVADLMIAQWRRSGRLPAESPAEAPPSDAPTQMPGPEPAPNSASPRPMTMDDALRMYPPAKAPPVFFDPTETPRP